MSSLLCVFLKYLKYLTTMGMLSIQNDCQSIPSGELSWAQYNGYLGKGSSKWWQNDDREFWWVMVGETNSGSHWHSVSPTRLELGSAQIWVAPLPNQIDGGGKFKCFVILILTSIAVLSLHNPHSRSQLGNLSKMFLQIFSVKGGWGTPPFR